MLLEGVLSFIVDLFWTLLFALSPLTTKKLKVSSFLSFPPKYYHKGHFHLQQDVLAVPKRGLGEIVRTANNSP